MFRIGVSIPLLLSFFFFNDTATTEIYTLSLHDALPICDADHHCHCGSRSRPRRRQRRRSEEHTSELQSRSDLVCRLLLEKKKTHTKTLHIQKRTRTVRKRTINRSTN